MSDRTLPWQSGDTVVTDDNVMFSQLRYDAIKAVKEGKATPEQIALVREADAKYQEAMRLRKEGK